jgi:gliding motility-associated-like protein
MRILKRIIFLSLILISTISFAQTLPSCPGNLIYLHNNPIQVYNPALPISASNPSSTGIPSGGSGLALMPNINAPTPSPTFYTTIGGNMAWWNGTSWVNTGHSTGNTSAVNLGGGGCYLYNLVGSTGQVYVYNGTGPATLLTTLTGFSGGGPYDICCDVNGNWYILKTTTTQSMTMYSPTGTQLASWTMTGMANTSAGGGFAVIGNSVYVSNGAGFYTGTISGSVINFTNNTAVSGQMSAGDYASCPVAGTISSYTANAITNGTLGCSTSSVGLTANTNISPVNSYSWSGPALSGPITNSTAIATAPGVYTCVITKTVCPMTQTIVTTTVTTNGSVINPSITASNILTCTNPTAQLTVTPVPPGYSYAWTGPGIVGANNVNVITVNQPGTYSCAVSNQTNTCQGSQTFAVTSNTAPPAVMITPSGTAICFGQNTTLTASGASTYTWSTNSNATNINVAPTANTNYSVIGTNSVNGCTNSAAVTVTVIPLPVPIANSNSPVCAGNALNLTGTGGTSYAWTGPNSFMSFSQNPSIAGVTMAAAGQYTLIAMAGTCSGSTTANVVINPLPVVMVGNNSPVCDGQQINFNASGGTSYSWNGPNAYTSNSQNPVIGVSSTLNNGVYVVTVTDANGCINSGSTPVTVNPLPVISISGSTICINQTINLNATGGNAYNWSGPAGFSSGSSSPSIPAAQPNMGGVYTVTVTDVNNCSNTSNTVVVVNPLPNPTAFNSSPVCVGGAFGLTGNGGVSYLWTGPNGFFSSSQNPTVSAFSANQSGNYVLTVSDNIGCTNTVVTAVVVNPLPVPSIISGSDKACAPHCITYTVSATSSLVTSSWSYNGSNVVNGNTASYCYSDAGIYTVNVSVTDVNNCGNSTSITSEVYPVPVADFNFAPLKPIINIDQEVTFTDASHSATITSWNWYFMNTAQYTSVSQNPTFNYTEPGTYAVALVVESDHGCLDTLVRELIVGEDFGIYVPNAFTPNGDGLNDVFQPKGFGITKYELNIFDRWGELLFHTTTFEEGWNGAKQKKKDVTYPLIIEEGVYTWLINCTNVFGKSHELKGHVTLIK